MSTDIQAAIATLDTVQASGPVATLIKKLPDATLRDGELLKWFIDSKQSWNEGGDYIYWNLMYNSRRAIPYSDMQNLSRTQQEFMKPMSILRANYTIDVTYSRTDLKKNANSPIKMADYAAKCLDLAKKNATQTLEFDILGDGDTSADGTDLTVLNSHHITGLGKYVENTPTSSSTVVAGQTRTSTTYWLNNQSLDLSSIAGLTPTNLHKLRGLCYEVPDVAFCSKTAFRALWQYAKGETWDRPLQRAIDLGVPEYLNMGGTAIVPLKCMTSRANGGLLSADITKIYFLNSEGIQLWVDPTDDWVLEPTVRAQDKLAYTQDLCWSGGLVPVNPAFNAVGYWT
jgi:hypothetical protein